jgi:two-component system cell cycle response regulator
MTEELRTYVGALQASRDELQAGVARIGDTLSGTHDLDRILTVVLDTAMAATRARAGAVLLLGADRSELELRVAQGLEERGVASDLRLSLGAGIAGRVAATGNPVRGRVEGPDLLPGPGEPTASTVLAVPLKSSTTVIGVLTLYDREDGEPFDEADLATLRTFTSQATVAVDNVVLHEEAQRLSITDGLTGLWNYRYFTMTIGKEIERAARFGRPLSLLLLDLDHFKLVNDVYGHQRGDAVLVELAGRIRGQVRDVDTVARYGGEEFVVILPETDEEGAVQAAERIRAAVRRRPFSDGQDTPLEITISVGVAVFPLHGAGSTSLLRRADQALYSAKRAGRDTWRLADVGAAED